MNNKNYDVVIIGAGIGGLVCGALLAKHGIKVLIVEKGGKPGGYCTSFSVRGFYFDAFVHALGNLSKGAQFYNILNQLGVFTALELIRYDPNDTVIMPKYKINFWNDLQRTISELIAIFPAERDQIKYFFNDLVNAKDITMVSLTRGKTFDALVNSIFHDKDLKNILSLFILGNIGMPVHQVNAFTAVKHYKQFILDGGYYPKGGIQRLPELLLQRFKDCGGEYLQGAPVVRVNVSAGVVKSVFTQRGVEIKSKFVVANSDATNLFLNLIDKSQLPVDFLEKLDAMQVSSSLFIVYLGFKKSIADLIPQSLSTWIAFDCESENSPAGFGWMLLSPTAKAKSCMLLTHSSYENKEFWRSNKTRFKENLLARINQAFPGIQDRIEFESSADPSVLNAWTGNHLGAGYGWAPTSDQFMDPDFTRDGIIKNLFLCGHWSTIAQGVEGVAIVGERVANIILKRHRGKSSL